MIFPSLELPVSGRSLANDLLIKSVKCNHPYFHGKHINIATINVKNEPVRYKLFILKCLKPYLLQQNPNIFRLTGFL